MHNWLKENRVFAVTILIAIFVIVFGAVFSSTLAEWSSALMSWVSYYFGWLYIISIVAFIGFCVWIATSKYGRIKLGKDDDKPEFSTFSWYAMLFCGSTGIGLVFWSIAEPLSHYAAPPVGIEPGSMEAINFSIRTCYLHWGITQWVCFAVVGLGIAYFQFRKGKNAQLSNLLTPLVGEKRISGWFGRFVDGFSVVVSFAGVATSLGLGVSQICGGLEHLFGLPKTQETILWIIVLITLVFIVSAITGVYKGIKLLSNFNTWLALSLLVLAFIVGPKITILNNLTNSVGQHIQYFFKDLFMTNAFGDNEWVMNWRVFYYAWFVAWVPFVGMFVARISKGRTIREFITGVVLVPTLFTILWLSVFSAIALSTVQGWSLENVQQLIASPETAVFIVFSEYPLSKVISVMIIVLLGVFFITSADSATYSLSVMTSNGDITPPTYKKVVWGVIVAAIAYILLSAGSLKPLQTISIAATLPFLLVMIAMMPALVKDLKSDNGRENK
jgi:glycine betaine transporter